jgi:vacuolar-type H+-ATPase subunit F/Vma7
MKKIVFITLEDAVNGFKLAGVSQYVTSAEEAELRLQETVTETDTGLVIIDERLLHNIAEDMLKKIEDKWSGTILVLPSPKRAEAEVEDYAARLIRQAIGYHVRLKL